MPKIKSFKTIIKILIFIAVVCYEIVYFLPRPFEKILPEMDTSQIVSCEAVYHLSETSSDGAVEITTKQISFEPGTEDFEELMSLLNSTTYRRKFLSLFFGSSKNGYSVTLNPHAQIYFYTDNEVYEYLVYGKCIPVGTYDSRRDYIPKGGEEFGKNIVDFINTHGTVTNENVSKG